MRACQSNVYMVGAYTFKFPRQAINVFGRPTFSFSFTNVFVSLMYTEATAFSWGAFVHVAMHVRSASCQTHMVFQAYWNLFLSCVHVCEGSRVCVNCIISVLTQLRSSTRWQKNKNKQKTSKSKIKNKKWKQTNEKATLCVCPIESFR